jgi:TP901 family phage tail tape measure protein
MASKGITLPITYKADLGGLKKAEDGLVKFGKVAAGIGAAAAAAVTGIAVKSVKAFADFDAKLNQSVAIMGNVSDVLRNDMSDAAREVAKTTTFSAAEAAESYFFLASAGLDAEASIAALPKVAAFAQAGMFDMATATDLLTDAQSALGLTSDDTTENLQNMADLGDVLVKANTLANASVQQFSEALTNKAGASMNALNMEMEEGVAVLAVFADQGIKGSQAGTTFNAAIRGLTNGALKNAEAFARLGVEVFDSEGAMNNMADIVADLENGLDGLSVEQQRAELSALGFTEETLAGTLALIGNSEALRDYEKDLRNAGGTVDDVAGKQLETFSGQLSLLQSGFEDTFLSIGKLIVPILLDLMKAMEPVMDDIGDLLVDVFKVLTPVLKDVAAQLPTLIDAFTPLIPIIGDIAFIFLDLVEALLPPFVLLLDALAPILDILVPILDIAVGLFKLLLIPVEGLIGFLTPLIETILPPLTSAFGLLSDAIGVLDDIFSPVVDQLMPAFNHIVEHVAGPIVNHFKGQLRQLADDGFQHLIDAGILPAGTSMTKLADIAKKQSFRFANFVITAFNDVLKIVNAVTTAFVVNNNTLLKGLQAFGLFKHIPPLELVIIPEIPLLTQFSFMEFPEVDVSDISGRAVPGGFRPMATGGIVTGPMHALIGEAGPEAVIPLDKMGSMGNTYNITINANVADARLGEVVVNAIKRYERTSGPVFASA